jgi:three-Cys-motif partner protein
VIDFTLYKGREQTGVKHLFLSEYLQRFGPIISSWCSTITYVDCFSGPWQQQSEALKDTSFFIALQELQRARERQRELSEVDPIVRTNFQAPLFGSQPTVRVC